MLGLPAGFEGDSSDEEFQVDNFYTPRKSNFTSPGDVKLNNSANSQQSIFQLKQHDMSLDKEAIRVAVIQDNAPLVAELLDKSGVKVDEALMNGWSALMYAGNNGSTHVLELLLKRKSNPDFQIELFTPLMATCYSTKAPEDKLLQCVQLLVEAYAKVNAHDRHLMTPLMYASKTGYTKIANYLCENGANVNSQDDKGWTSLCFACHHGFMNMSRLLLRNKADVNITTQDSQTAADIAFSRNFKLLCEMLENYNENESTEEILDEQVDRSDYKTDKSRFVSFGDLELFIHGLELSHILPLLKEHKIDFAGLLRMNEEQMIEIGMKQVGVRKKLLEAIRTVHINEWDMADFSLKNKLNLLECSSVMANVSKHLTCIYSAVEYMENNLHKCQLENEHSDIQRSLVEQCKEAHEQCTKLNSRLTQMSQQTSKMFPNMNEKTVDLIESADKRTTSSTFRHATYFAVGTTLLTGTCYLLYRHVTK